MDVTTQQPVCQARLDLMGTGGSGTSERAQTTACPPFYPSSPGFQVAGAAVAGGNTATAGQLQGLGRPSPSPLVKNRGRSSWDFVMPVRRRPENGQVFSVRTAPIGGTKGRKRKRIAPFSTKTKFSNKNRFQQFFRARFFLPVGSLTDKTGPQPTNSRPNRHHSDPQPVFSRPTTVWGYHPPSCLRSSARRGPTRSALDDRLRCPPTPPVQFLTCDRGEAPARPAAPHAPGGP